MRGRSARLACFALLLASCAGDGSDIGPRLQPLPRSISKLIVLDDQGRGVSGARVTIGGVTAKTGRSGRGDLFADPRGVQFVQVLTDAASATDGDRLAPMWFAAELPGGEVPFAIHVPDLSASDALVLGIGAQPARRFDESASGAALEIATGTSVTNAFQPSATLRFGTLQATHLPPRLPAPASGTWLVGRGYWLDPVTVTFQPPAALEVPDDLGLPTGAQATLFWLDPFTGEWTEVAATATQGGGRLRLDGAVRAGGLYVFAAAVPAPAVVGGRVVDALARPIAGAHVRVDQAVARTGFDGRFSIADVAGTFANGTARAAAVEVRGGVLWLPEARSTTTAALGPGAVVDLGDVLLDTVPAGNLRLQAIVRGRADPFRRIPLSTLFGNVAVVGFGDEQGQLVLEDVPAAWFGSAAGRPVDGRDLFLMRSLGFFDYGRAWLDVSVFFDRRPFFVGSRTTRALLLDAVGGGPIDRAVLVRGSTAAAGFSGTTLQGGVAFSERSFDGRATGVVQTAVQGRTVTSAFSIERPNGDVLELPLERALRTPIGAFDRHALVAGSLTNANSLAEHRVAGSRLLTPGEWMDSVFSGVPIRSRLPVKVDPALGVLDFRVGVGVPYGHLVGVEGTMVGGALALERIGIAADLRLVEAEVTERDLALDLAADTTYTATGLLQDLDPGVPLADLRYDLALLQPSGRVVDVVRDAGGNLVAAGQDLQIRLPALAGPLAGHQWLCAVGTVDGAPAQRALLRFDASATASTAMLALPTITAPANAASVPASGFDLQFALPTGALYATIELRSDGTDTLAWTAVVPNDRTSFAFVPFPAEAKPLLVAGRDYTLTLTAWRADEGLAVQSDDPYRDLATFWFSIDPWQRGVRAASSRSITITVN